MQKVWSDSGKGEWHCADTDDLIFLIIGMKKITKPFIKLLYYIYITNNNGIVSFGLVLWPSKKIANYVNM